MFFIVVHSYLVYVAHIDRRDSYLEPEQSRKLEDARTFGVTL